MHSSCSDGTVTPGGLALLAKKNRVSVASLTDHDTVSGVGEFLAFSKKYGVKALSGVEFSAQYPVTMHILGYGFDHLDPSLLSELDELRRNRDMRNGLIVQKLKALGVQISLEEVKRESKGGVVTRPHVARVLISKGYASSIKDCFDRYLGKGAPAYVPRKSLSPERCLSLIKDSGGVGVLAHPFQTTQDISELKDILTDLKSMGLWGLECISGNQSAENIYKYMALAAELGLQCTAGSDYHGANRKSVSMGVPVPEDFLPWARLGLAL